MFIMTIGENTLKKANNSRVLVVTIERVQHLKLRCRNCWAKTYVMLPIEFDELAKKTLPHVHNDDWREYVEESEQQ
jgi:hypothetical protein